MTLLPAGLSRGADGHKGAESPISAKSPAEHRRYLAPRTSPAGFGFQAALPLSMKANPAPMPSRIAQISARAPAPKT